MRYLLDTHTFIWFINDSPMLSKTAKEYLEFPQNTLFLSIATIWEMAIKISLGKLIIPEPFTDFINQQLEENAISLLEIKTDHLGILTSLPFHHRDPFDRLLISQSKHENLPVIGKDLIFDEYQINRIW